GRVREDNGYFMAVPFRAHSEVAQHRVRRTARQGGGGSIPDREQEVAGAADFTRKVEIGRVPLRARVRLTTRHGGRLPGELDAAHLLTAEQVLEHPECSGIEIGCVLRERFGQYGVDADVELESDLCDEQVCTGGHSCDDAELGIGQMPLQEAEEIRNGATDVLEVLRPQVPVS